MSLRPAWVIYSDLTLTSKAYMKHVSAVEQSWVAELVESMQHVQVEALTGRAPKRKVEEVEESATVPQEEVKLDKRNNETTISAARQRFLERQAQKKASQKVKK